MFQFTLQIYVFLLIYSTYSSIYFILTPFFLCYVIKKKSCPKKLDTLETVFLGKTLMSRHLGQDFWDKKSPVGKTTVA